jgi:beta-lactam-binding protein with PASTA domain
MNDQVRTRLRELIARNGTGLADDPRRVEAMLRDIAPHDTQEIFVLVSALRAQLVPEARQWHNSLPPEALVRRLTDRLQRQLGLAEESARWSVESWLLALEIPLPHPPKPSAKEDAEPYLAPTPPENRRGQSPHPPEEGAPVIHTWTRARRFAISRRLIIMIIAILAAGAAIGTILTIAGANTKAYSVPLVNNEPLALAEQQIKASHLRCCAVVSQPSSSVAKDHVIRSNPPEGNNVAANTMVTLYDSSGPGDIAVPGVVGQQQAQAEAILTRAGFKPVVKTDPTSNESAGQVISQSPAPPAKAAPGSTVTITVSGRQVTVSPLITVPLVIGDSQQTASQILTNAGFEVNVQQRSGPPLYPNGTVFSQTPNGNDTATKGSQVIIYVQNGASPSTSPSTSSSPTITPTGPPTGTPTGPGGGGGGF